MIFTLIAILFLAYLLGSVPFGYLAGVFLRGVDIRKSGSGNIGATNAARVLGWRFFPAVFMLDLLKGLLPVLVMQSIIVKHGLNTDWSPSPWIVAAGLCAILGHVFPLFLDFKGGKAVATSSGVFLMLTPGATFIAAAVWGVVFLGCRYVSLASVSAAVALPAIVILWSLPDPFNQGIFLTMFCLLGAALVIVLHRSNIRRLLSGTENRVGRQAEKP